MKRYAFFRGYIITVNADNTIPLNAICVAQPMEREAPSEVMVAQANVAIDLYSALDQLHQWVHGNVEGFPGLSLYAQRIDGQVRAALEQAKRLSP